MKSIKTMKTMASCMIAAALSTACAAAEAYRLGDVTVSFRLALGRLSEKKVSMYVVPASMSSLSVLTNSTGTITAVWKGHPECGQDFRMTAALTPRKDGGYDWGLSYSGYSSRLAVESIAFPVLTVPRTDETRLLLPDNEGVMRLPDWKTIEPRRAITTCGPGYRSARFMATLTPGAKTFYVDQRIEHSGHATIFRLAQGAAPMTLEMAAEYMAPIYKGPPVPAGGIPFGGVIRAFDPCSWFTPTAYYREWAKDQRRYAAAKELRERNPRLRDIGLWLWNRGRSATVTGIVDRVARDTGATIALDWYWWHVNPYGRDAPYYWPARDDMETFTGTIRALKAKGVYVQHYINGVSCDVMHPAWNDQDWAETVVNRDGSYRQMTWNPFFKHPSAVMCSTASVFHDRLSQLCRNLREAGTDSIYIDQIAHECTPCWSARHGHPRGGGTYMYDENIKLLERLRRENPGVNFSSEGSNEAYLGAWESLILLSCAHEKQWCRTAPAHTLVPIFQAIYHPVVTMYGNYATIDNQPPWDELWPVECQRGDLGDLVSGFPDQFAVELARSTVIGQQPCAHMLLAKHADDPATAASYMFLCDTVKFYVANRDLLFDGEMLDPGRMECDGLDVRFLSYSTYTPKGKEKVCTQKDLSTVFHSVWRTPDGKPGAVLANWSRQDRRYRLETPDMGVCEGIVPARSWLRVAPARK